MIIVCTYALILWYAVAASARLRNSTRRMVAVKIYVGDDSANARALGLLKQHVEALLDLDEQRRRGEIDELRYEAGWSAVYDKLPTAASLR